MTDRKAILSQKVKAVTSCKDKCGICENSTNLIDAYAVEVTFSVDLILTSKDVSKQICLDCVVALRDRLHNLAQEVQVKRRK